MPGLRPSQSRKVTQIKFDQILMLFIDYFLAYDPSSKVACETLVTTGQVVRPVR